jgi:hypothetical protein
MVESPPGKAGSRLSEETVLRAIAAGHRQRVSPVGNRTAYQLLETGGR